MKLRFVSVMFVLVSLSFNGLAQTGFGGECPGAKNELSESLQKQIRKNRIDTIYQDCDLNEEMCGGSFAFDLDLDDRKEYVVRLGCGATGNCTYGIFGDRPVRLISTFTAWFFWVDKSDRAWPKITAYEREGGDQGYITTYTFRRGKYRRSSGRTEKFNPTEKSFPEKMGMPDCDDLARTLLSAARNHKKLDAIIGKYAS